MLDRTKIIKAIDGVEQGLFTPGEDQVGLAFVKWQEIIRNPDFQHRAVNSKSSFLVPTWSGGLGFAKRVLASPADHSLKYAILAVDGSQIYPERHMHGINCFLVNVGQCLLEYSHKSRAVMTSEPKIIMFDQVFPSDNDFFSLDLVDFKREELELGVAIENAINLHREYQKQDLPFATFFDGSLIFWQLEGKSEIVKKYFLNQYLDSLDGFYRHRIPIASYISMPKSRELINLIKIDLCSFPFANCISCHSAFQTFPCNAVDNVYDTQLCGQFLDRFERTTVFQTSSKVVEHYPSHLKPCFLYLNVGYEVIRLEFPNWVAESDEYLQLICSIAIDQAYKGNGYSIALAEAHEQAVVKTADRDFFYHLVNKRGLALGKRVCISHKGLKKHSSNF